jgi:hypothetical protein
LEEIGKPALPAVLEIIKSSSSAKARENALIVWMEIYKYEPPKGVAVLQHEAVATDDPAVKLNLQWALSKAPIWCMTDRAGCEAAAVLPH